MLADSRAATSRPRADRTISEIRSSELRVECLKCFRIVTLSREGGPAALRRRLAMEGGRQEASRRRLRAPDRAS